MPAQIDGWEPYIPGPFSEGRVVRQLGHKPAVYVMRRREDGQWKYRDCTPQESAKIEWRAVRGISPRSLSEIRRSLKPTLAKKVIRGIKRRTIGDAPIKLYTRLLPRSDREIWCSPEVPNHPTYAIYKIAAKLGLRLSPVKTPNTVAALAWKDSTFCDPAAHSAINARCTDISKHLVETEFAKAFGYALAIDPLTFQGDAIRKSNENALHVGEVIKCPIIKADPASSYERLIDSSIDDTYFEEIRIPIVGSEIPHLYIKVNPLAHRFGNWIITCGMVDDVSLILSEQEQQNCLKLARAMNMDYGELDALRDKHSGKLYIIDVNKTPSGPPAPLNLVSKVRAIGRLARSFERLITAR